MPAGLTAKMAALRGFRGFILVIVESEHFFWVGQTTRGGPLIVQLPATLQKRYSFAKSIGAAEEHNHQMTRVHRFHLTLANNFRLTIRIQNHALACSR